MPLKAPLKWTRAKLIPPSDHIISSKARELGEIGFWPTYYDNRYKFGYLMQNEYRRLWFEELQVYQKEHYSKREQGMIDQSMKRGYVTRMMTKPKLKQRELKIIQLKRFQDIPAKVDNRRTKEELERVCGQKIYEQAILERYKIDCKKKRKTKMYTN